MAQINFTGNVGQDAVMGFTQSGAAKLEFSVADTKGKKDAQGNWDKEAEQTQWLRCTLWGPDAEHYAERLKKGARVTVYGEFMAREWTTQEGVVRTSLDVTVRGLNVINKRGAEQNVNAASAPYGQQQNHGGYNQGQQQQQNTGWNGGQQQQQQQQGGWGGQQSQPGQQANTGGWGNGPSEPPF